MRLFQLNGKPFLDLLGVRTLGQGLQARNVNFLLSALKSTMDFGSKGDLPFLNKLQASGLNCDNWKRGKGSNKTSWG